jgi:hypothetical protein
VERCKRLLSQFGYSGRPDIHQGPAALAVLLLQTPIPFPTSRLRDQLGGFFAGITWWAGDADLGQAGRTTPFERAETILGRTRDQSILCTVQQNRHPYGPANGHVPPDHRLHVTIGAPTTDDAALARGIALIVGVTLAAADATVNPDVAEGGAWLQLEPGSPWYSVTDMRSLAKMLENDRTLPRRFEFGRPEVAAAPADTSGARRPVSERLGSFTLLLDGDVHIDWAPIAEAMNIVDPGGDWCIVASPGGMGFATGRSRLHMIWAPMPYEADAIEQGRARSFWFDGDRTRVARHRHYLTIALIAPEAFADRVSAAKAMTIMVALLARLPQVAAVFNNMVMTLFTPDQVQGQAAILARNEVPIQLWIWAAPNALTDGDVSLTTGGLAPFVGYEVEVWNAPLSLAVATEKLNGVLRYLLSNGPVVAHGDTIGDNAVDQTTRCFFAPSRAERPEPVDAMMLEFDSGPSASPRRDLAPPPRPDPVPPPRPAATAMRRPVFGRKRV